MLGNSVLGKALIGVVAAPAVAVALTGAVLVGTSLAGTSVAGTSLSTASVAGTTGAALAVPTVPDQPVADIPPAMLALYREAPGRECPGLPWTVLAGIGRVETDHGRDTAVSSAGAEGPMQFLPATFAEYGVDADGGDSPDIFDPADAVLAAARMLCADGGGRTATLATAIYAYNHSIAYVAAVLGWAQAYATAYGTGDTTGDNTGDGSAGGG